jgi:predicted naringenin-chalcone synthase
LRILGIAIAVPEVKYSTEELVNLFPAKLSDGILDSIFNLGVLRRHIAFNPKSNLIEKEAVSDICSEACIKVLEKTGLQQKDINYLVAAYDYNDFCVPGLSSLLVKKVGFPSYIRHLSVQGMGCSAFGKVLQLAKDYLARYHNDYVMLCFSGVNSYWFQGQVRGIKNVLDIKKIRDIKDDKQREFELRKWIATLQFFLFGDGAASIIVTNNKGKLKVGDFVYITNLGEADYLTGYAKIISLNRPFSFEFHSYLSKNLPELGLKYTSKVLELLTMKYGFETIVNAKKWVVHTGSRKILDSIAERYSVNREKLKESYEVLERYGNLGGASLPFILEKVTRSHGMASGDNIITLGFGWGFMADAGLLTLV